MQSVQVKLKTTIIQDNDSETFEFDEQGQIEETASQTNISYKESGTIPVQVRFGENEVTLLRGVKPVNYSELHFAVGQRSAAIYVVDGNDMAISTQTKSINKSRLSANSQQITIEYDLFAGINLVGNYYFQLIFIK